MATLQIDGSSAVTTNSTNNNGGSMLANGTVSSNVVTSISTAFVHGNVFASTVLDNGHADEALDAGTFAYNNQRPVAKRTTSTISGVSNTVLRSGAGQPADIRSIHKVETVRTRRFCTAIRANKYNRFTNTFDGGFPVVATDDMDQATDVASNPTRDVPGHLTFKGGQPLPVSVNYKPKTGG